MDSPSLKQGHAISGAKTALASIFRRMGGAVACLCFVISAISISPWQVAPHYAQSRAEALLTITVTDLPVPRFIIHHGEILKERKRPSQTQM